MGKITEKNLSENLRELSNNLQELSIKLSNTLATVKEFHTKEDAFNIEHETKHLARLSNELEFLAFKHDKKFE